MTAASPEEGKSIAVTAASPEEAAFIASLEGRGRLSRYGAYLRRGGPGYLQSAMTLGGGTAASSLFAGRMFGYELLWVAPVGMLIGILLLGVLARLALEDTERPYAAMARSAGKWVAMAWALGALIASVIWHFPQYALAGAAVEDVGQVMGIERLFGVIPMTPVGGAFAVLAIAVAASLLYGRTPRLARAYELFVQVLIMGVIACFGLVVINAAGDIDWGAVARGFIPHIPEPRGGQDPWILVASGLGAAVGINMVLLYPYSLRTRGWGKEHVECARFDLFAGMLVPYTLATTLVLVATATTIPWEGGEDLQKLKPVQAAQAFGAVLGETGGRLVFDLGLLGMALSTIALHMIASGFALAEMTGAGPKSLAYRLGTFLPVPGVLGPLFWKDLLWLAVPTNIVCGLFLPITYVGVILWARRAKRPSPGPVLALMALATIFLTAVLTATIVAKLA